MSYCLSPHLNSGLDDNKSFLMCPYLWGVLAAYLILLIVVEWQDDKMCREAAASTLPSDAHRDEIDVAAHKLLYSQMWQWDRVVNHW